MAAPNIVNVGTITGRTYSNILTTSNVLHVVNASASNTVVKINSILVTNVDGATAADVTLELNNATGNGAPYRIASTISVPADATLIVVDRSTSLYLEENQSIKGFASANGDLEIIISYDIIS
jgi:hypothetical protein